MSKSYVPHRIFKRGPLNFSIILARFLWKIYYREEMPFLNSKKCVNVRSLLKAIIHTLINLFLCRMYFDIRHERTQSKLKELS